MREDVFLTPTDVAKLLSVSVATARAYMKEMRYINISTGGQRQVLRVPRAEITSWMLGRTAIPDIGQGKKGKKKPKVDDRLKDLLDENGHIKKRKLNNTPTNTAGAHEEKGEHDNGKP